MAVDERALEAERRDAALKLADGGARLLHRQMRKAGVAGRDAGDLGCEKSLALWAALMALAVSRSICTPGEISDRTETSISSRIHRSDAQLGELTQALVHETQEPRLEQIGAYFAGVRKSFGPEMLFERNFFHVRL